MSGEFDRIRAILARLGGAAARDIGDDCAIVPDGPGQLVVSTDLSIEGTHFRTSWLNYEEIGWRCAAGALSDLAAQGAAAVGLTASVGVPTDVPEPAVADLMAGVGAAVRDAGGIVLGGDLARAPQWVVDITVLGRATHPVRRTGAVAGDALWVSGSLGGARAALRAWIGGGTPDPAARAAFAHPVPRISLGQALAQAGVSAMIDLSDGLAGDVQHLAAASGVALAVDLARLPLHPAVGPEGGLLFAARGGEDYELLFTTALSDDIMTGIARDTGVPLTRIGSVKAGGGVQLLLEGQSHRLEGYDHFA